MNENQLINTILELASSMKNYLVLLDECSKSPYIIGYWKNNNEFIVYMTTERGDLQLEKAFESKLQALNYLHELVKFEISLSE